MPKQWPRLVAPPDSTPLRVLGYARVSSEEQALGSSLADQQRAMDALAASRCAAVDRFFVEAESAVFDKLERRVEMQRLMREARRGDLILCDKLDRWSRDPEFSYRSVRELLERGCSIYFVADRIDPSTPDGDTAMSFRILFAREEHKRIKERLVGTRRLMRDRGYYVEGLTPYGYRRRSPKGTKDPEKNALLVEPDEAKAVRRVFELTASGQSISRVVTITGLTRDRVVSIAKSRVYLGQVRNTKGEWIPARHEAIIDEALFERARRGIAERNLRGARPRSQPGAETDGWILRDVATCGLCASRMSAAYAGTHDARRYYYRCARGCTSRYVRVETTEAAFADVILARLEMLREELAKAPPSTEPDAPAGEPAEMKRAKLVRKRARYVEMYAEGVVTHDALRTALGKIDAELMKLDAEAPAAPLVDRAARVDALREVTALRAGWAGADGPGRRQIVGLLVRRVLLATGTPPAPEWRSAEELAERV